MLHWTAVAQLLATVEESAAPWMDRSDPPAKRAAKLVAQMTQDEKVHLFHGSGSGYVGNVEANTRLGIPAIKMNDGPQGFRDNAHLGSSTAWPCGLAIGATWDIEASSAWGTAMGDEFYRKGANVQLGPGVCLARVPRNGRNFEYISGEDPYLGYVMVQPAVRGIQSQGVVANAKHFVNNNQETDRGTVDEEVDERTQFELYYPPFAGAVAANVGSVMCSYNRIRTKWSCENPETLQRDLKDRTGFQGWVMSDWGATHSMSMVAGLDQEMPGSDHMGDDAIKKAVSDGTLSQARVDDGAARILTPLFAVGVFDSNNTNPISNNVSTAAHTALARSLAADSLVLLQNDGTLPLATTGIKLALIGGEAKAPTVHGGGSGQVVPAYVPAPYDSIRNALGLPGAPAGPMCPSGATWDAGFDYRNTDEQTEAAAASADACCALCSQRTSPSKCNYWSFQKSQGGKCWMKSTNDGRTADSDVISGPMAPPAPPCDASGKTCVYYDDGSNTGSAAATAAKADVAIVFVATNSHEGADRDSLSFDNNADALVAAVAKSGAKKVVVAAVAPGAALTPWRADVAAITYGFMPGQEYANGLTDVLFGKVNPSAKLPLSLPVHENDVNFTDAMWPGVGSNPRTANYSEKLHVGYRWYDAHKVAPAFAFGHGLSYSTFALSGLKASADSVSATVTNTGDRAGATVVQLYLGFPEDAGEPPQQLKGFSKQPLKPGQSADVTFKLSERDRSIWDVGTHAWAEAKGTFAVSVGFSSRDPKALGGSFVV